MITIKTYTDFSNPEVLEKIEYVMNLATHDDNNRMPDNYTTKKLALNDTLAVSIAESNGEPYSYSSLMHRKIYGNSARVLSRYYVLNRVPLSGLKPADRRIKYVWRDHALDMLKEQTTIAYDMGYEGVFISQHDKSIKLFTRMYHGLEKLSEIKGWKFDPDKKYRVCNGEDCEHWIFHHGKLFLEEV